MRVSLVSFVMIVFLTACFPGNTDKAVGGQTIKQASYQSATVYAAASDYYFKAKNGEAIQFRVSNLPDEKTVVMPSDMLASIGEEGPPEANPALQGRKFNLIYDKNMQLQRVELINDLPASTLQYGSTLQQVQQANGKAFTLLGFEIDGYLAGKVVDWNGGALEGKTVQFSPTVDLPSEEYQQIMGDSEFSSDNSVMQKAGLKVVFFK